MPADTTLPETSIRHGNASEPYQCSTQPKPPGWAGFIDYGFCRHSLDTLAGVNDPRCPKDCQHKAPASIVEGFAVRFASRGAMAAAEWVRSARNQEAA